MRQRHDQIQTGINPKYYAIACMIAIIGASNYLVQFPINDWLTWGAFPYPISFLVTELTNRVYGPRIARQVVCAGFLCAGWLSLWFFPVIIAVASVTAFLVAQFLDIFVFNRLRRMTWWYAPLFASLAASFVDTAIFWFIAFYGEDSLPVITWAMGDFGVKVVLDVIMLTPFRFLINKSMKPIAEIYKSPAFL